METIANLCFCRLCLNWAKGKIDLESSFEIVSKSAGNTRKSRNDVYSNIKTYLDCYCFVGKVKAALNENISNKLCKGCGEELTNAFNFIRKIQNAENILHQIVPGKENMAHAHDPIEVPADIQIELVEQIIEAESCLNDESYVATQMESEEITNEDKKKEDNLNFISEPVEMYKDVEISEDIKNSKNANKVKKIQRTRTREMDKHKLDTNYECETCCKKYTSIEKLNIHRRKHEDEPTACEICGKKFVTKYYMRLHMRTHEEERTTYNCDECGRKYYHENSLMMHKRIHTGDLLECDECHKKFVCRRELRVHKNSHNRIYQYVCDICGGRYLRINHLNTHMLRHKGMKAQCVECGKLFNSKRGLYEHNFVHTGKMPFPCSFCERGYPSRQKYKIHLKNVHDVELTEDEVRKCMENLPIQKKRQTVKWVQVDA